MKKFGVVTPWINLKNAEYEVIERMRIASKNIGVELILMDNFGTILDEEQKRTDKKANPRELEFILSLHYESPKFLDSFYYGILWNPPYYIIKFNERLHSVENYNMYDAFLTYDSKGVQRHAYSMLYSSKAKLFRNMDFVASPARAIYKPNLENPKMFYCGINFERARNSKGKTGRHISILSQLEETNNLKIFGPKKLSNGEFPWDGYSSYCGEIPFDGISLIKEIHECGVVLMLSSDVHRKFDVVTSRIYEAAAAGAIVISNKSEFIKKEFGDSVLTIDYEVGNQEGVAEQILNHFEWIQKNPKKAEIKAKKLQKIFKEKFCMEKQLNNLFRKHKEIKKEVSKDIYSKKIKEEVDVILYWDKEDTERLEEIIENINIQQYQNLNLIAGFDNSILKQCKNIINKKLNKKIKKIKILGLDIFNKNLPKGSNGYKKLGNGKIISILADYSKAKYCAFMNNDAIWFSDHITTLKRNLEDNKNKQIAYSGIFSKEISQNNAIRYLTLNSFRILDFDILKHFDLRFSISSMLITKNLLNKYKKGFLDVIDKFEFFLVAFDGLANNISIFSKKMTSGTIRIADSKIIKSFSLEPLLQIDYIKSLFRNKFNFTDKSVKQKSSESQQIKKVNTSANNNSILIFKGIDVKKYLLKKYKKSLRYKISKLFKTKSYKKLITIKK